MTTPDTPPLPSDAELAILQVLWKRGALSAKEIHGELNAGRTAPRVVTTTAKLLQIMLGKKLVDRDETTWPHTYTALAARAAVQRGMVAKTVADVFDKSAGQFMLAALEAGTPSKAEIEEIKAMLVDYEERQKDHE